MAEVLLPQIADSPLLKVAAQFVPGSVILWYTKLAMETLIANMERKNEKRVTQLSRVWVGALVPFVTLRRDTKLVGKVFHQCGAEFTRLIQDGEASRIQPTISAGIDFASRVIETENQKVIDLLIKHWLPELERAFEKKEASALSAINAYGKKIDLSNHANRIESRTVAATCLITAQGALGRGKINVLRPLAWETRKAMKRVVENKSLSVYWLKDLVASVHGKGLQLPQLALEVAIGLLRLRGEHAVLFEGTITEILLWILKTAEFAGFLRVAAPSILELAERKIQKHPDQETQDAVKRIFHLAKDYLGTEQSEVSEALGNIISELQRLDPSGKHFLGP